jgi:hypothetical protein
MLHKRAAQFVRESIQLNAGTGGWTSCTAILDDGRYCPKPARSFATYGDDGHGRVWLCPPHMTIERVTAAARLNRTAGDAWVS